MRARSVLLLLVGAAAALPGCYLAHERGTGRDFSSCDALGGVCEGSDLGCLRFGDTHAFAGTADCIDRDEGFACCVPLAEWTPSGVGERCFDDDTCASGACVEGVCGTGRVCVLGGAATCGADEHCWVPGDVSGHCLPRCDDRPCPGLLECTPDGCAPR